MSPLDKGFQKRIARIYDDWRQSIATALENGIEHGTVRKDVSPHAVAALMVAAFAGLAGTVKSAQKPEFVRPDPGSSVWILGHFEAMILLSNNIPTGRLYLRSADCEALAPPDFFAVLDCAREARPGCMVHRLRDRRPPQWSSVGRAFYRSRGELQNAGRSPQAAR